MYGSTCCQSSRGLRYLHAASNSDTSNQAKKPLAQQKVCCLHRFIVSALSLGALLRWTLAKCRHTLPSTIHCAEGYLFYRCLENLNTFAICFALRGMLVDNYACWCQEYFLATHGRDYSPSTSVDFEHEGVVVVFRGGRVQSFQECSRGWPESTDVRGSSPSLVSSYARQACMDGFKRQPLGPPC